MGGEKIDVAADFRDLLRAFGAPLHDLTVTDLATPGIVFQSGLPPLRIDVLTQISGVEFARAWPRRLRAMFDDVAVAVLGRADFLANKRATGRLQDLADAERLVRTRSRRKLTQRARLADRPRLTRRRAGAASGPRRITRSAGLPLDSRGRRNSSHIPCDSSSSNALASFKSRVSNPSVNQP